MLSEVFTVRHCTDDVYALLAPSMVSTCQRVWPFENLLQKFMK